MVSEIKDVEYLQGLIRALDEAIHMNYKVLDDKEALERERKEAALRRKKELKERVRLLLVSYEKGADTILPLWKHKLNGFFDPPKHLILKGKSLLKSIVNTIILIYLRPFKHIFNRKLANRKTEKEFLFKNLALYTPTFDQYFSNLIRIPLISIQDELLEFEFKQRGRFDFTNSKNKRNVLSLKVRLKSIIQSIVESKLNTTIGHNLLTVMIHDGNYFKRDYLFSYEKDNLNFDRLGGTSNICPTVHNNENNNKDIVNINDEWIDISLPKMLLQNYLIIRVLINHIILSPWFYSVCSKPSKKCLLNYRVVASLIYMITSRIDPDLPEITQQEPNFDHHPQPDIENQASTLHEKTKPTPTRHKEQSNILHAVISGKSPAPHLHSNPSALRRHSFLSKRVISHHIDIDEHLLNPRPTFESLEAIQSCLLPKSYFSHVSSMIEPWLVESASLLDNWLTALTVDVIISSKARSPIP